VKQTVEDQLRHARGLANVKGAKGFDYRRGTRHLAIRGIDAQGMKGQPRHSAKPRNSESVPMSSSHVFNQTAQNEVFDGLWREAAGDFGGVLAEFLNVHMSEWRKGGKYTITGQPQVDDFSALLRSE
jgi:hypothetical protein